MQASQLRPLGCHKDAHQSVKATWLGSADAPQGCAGFQKAAQNLEQSNQADVTVYLFIENKIGHM